jgi:hypothetical protein
MKENTYQSKTPQNDMITIKREKKKKERATAI